MKYPVFLIVLVLLAFAGPASAELYKYTDSRGELHFVDDISKVPKKYRKQLESAEPEGNANFMDTAPASRYSQESTAQEPPPEQRRVASPSTNVEVFMTSWCGYCRKMIRFLNEKGIPYTAYDIEKDSAAARVYRELGVRGVPVVRVGSRVVSGYNPEAVMSYLKERK